MRRTRTVGLLSGFLAPGLDASFFSFAGSSGMGPRLPPAAAPKPRHEPLDRRHERLRAFAHHGVERLGRDEAHLLDLVGLAHERALVLGAVEVEVLVVDA